MLAEFYGFETLSNLIFLGWQIFELFLGVSQNFRYFFRSGKFPAIFFEFSNFCITYLNPVNEEHTVLESIKLY